MPLPLMALPLPPVLPRHRQRGSVPMRPLHILCKILNLEQSEGCAHCGYCVIECMRTLQRTSSSSRVIRVQAGPQDDRAY